MAEIKVKCPYCGSEEVSLYGKNSTTGRQRYLCRNKACSHKTFQLEYKNNACRPGTKEKVVEMTMNGSGTRDTGRVLGISPNTVTAVLKKRKNSQNKSMKITWKTEKKIRLSMLKFVPSWQKWTKCGVIITTSLTQYGYGGRWIMKRMCLWLIHSAQGSISIWMNFLLYSNRFQLERFMLTTITHIKSGFHPICWFQGKRIRKKSREII